MRKTPFHSGRSAAMLAAATLAIALAGCSPAQSEEAASNKTEKTSAVETQEQQSEQQSKERPTEAQPTTTPVVSGRPMTVEEAMASNHSYWTVDTEVQAQQTELELDLADAAENGTVTIDAAGTYVLTGKLDGQLVVAAADDAQVTLVLAGVEISNGAGPAVLLDSADGVRIELAEGTVNKLSDADSYTGDADEDSALFSRVDLEIDGSGSLEVTGNGSDAIASKDDLVISGGNIRVIAADDGVRGKDALVITGGTLDVVAAGDGMKTTNEEEADRGYYLQKGGDVTISAGDDGLDSVADALISDGTLTITESVEGIEAINVIVEGGQIDITSSDDGINATAGSSDATGRGGFGDDGSNLVVAVGTVTINAEGDGVDSNGNLTISGGTVNVFGTTRGGNGAFDANGTFTLSGGEILALSAGQMEQGPSSVEQPYAEVSLSGQAGTEVQVSAGSTSISVQAPKQFGYVFYSSPDLAEGAQVSFEAADASAQAAATTEASAEGIGGPGGMGGPGAGEGPGGGPGRPDSEEPGDFPGEPPVGNRESKTQERSSADVQNV